MAGGSDGSRLRLWKTGLQQLADLIRPDHSGLPLSATQLRRDLADRRHHDEKGLLVGC
jgi:hypothetical protein